MSPPPAAFLNPPYSRRAGGLEAWLAKARAEAAKGITVVCLIPARTDTRAWSRHAMKADEIRFIGGRLKFGDAKQAAPFPSAVVIFRPRTMISGPGGMQYTLTSAAKPLVSYLHREHA